MRTGERRVAVARRERLRARRPHRRPGRTARGFGYLLLLFALALGAAALAAAGSRWQVALQREREVELVFRGLQIRDALERYVAATPAGEPAVPPPALRSLLVDTRGPAPRHWLRRLYADPFTGRPDWVLLRDDAGGIVGVASRSTRPALRRHAVPADLDEAGQGTGGPPRVGDWQFRIDPERLQPRGPDDPRSPT